MQYPLDVKKAFYMQRMPVIVSPELSKAEAHWLEKASPRDFSFVSALEVSDNCSVMS